MPQQMIVD